MRPIFGLFYRALQDCFITHDGSSTVSLLDFEQILKRSVGQGPETGKCHLIELDEDAIDILNAASAPDTRP
jgi:hypothetical protein